MPADQTSIEPPKKSLEVIALRIGMHPIVFSVMTIVGVGALVFFFGFAPMVKMTQAGGSASVVDAKGRNDAAASSLEAQKKLVGLAGTLTAHDRDLLAYALPSEEDIPTLTVILRSLAVRSGARLATMDIAKATTPEAGAAGGQPSIISSQITLGLELVTYDRFKLVLSTIENSLRIFDIQNMTYTPSTGSLSLQLKTYYLNSL